MGQWLLTSSTEFRNAFQPTTAKAINRNAVSPGGRYYAFQVGSQIYVHDLERDGALVGQIPVPSSGSNGISENLQSLHHLQLRFSHDGTKLAALLSYGSLDPNRFRVICWDVEAGRMLSQFWLSKPLSAPVTSRQNELVWAPDDSALLCFRRWLVDPKTGWVLAQMSVRKALNASFYGFVDAGSVAALMSCGGDYVVYRCELPLDPLRGTQQLLAKTDAGWVRPGQAVSLAIDVESVRFSSEEKVAKELRTILEQRLRVAGLTVAQNQPATLQVVYNEKPGVVMEVTDIDLDFSSLWSRRVSQEEIERERQKYKSKKVRATDIAVKLLWRTSDGRRTLWSYELEHRQSFAYFKGEPNEAKARDDSFQTFRKKLLRVLIPYFVPRDETKAVLPMSVDLSPTSGRLARWVRLKLAPLSEKEIYEVAAQAAQDAEWPPRLVAVDDRSELEIRKVGAAYPAAKPADTAAVAAVELPETAPAWQPLVDPTTGAERPLLPLSVRWNDWEDTRKLLFSTPTAGRAVALLAEEETSSRAKLIALDLLRSQIVSTIELPGRAELLALSPDGRLAAVRFDFAVPHGETASSQRRLDVYSLDDGKHLVGWEPYAEETLTAAVPVAAAFVDANRLLTLNDAGRLMLWQIPECRAVYSISTKGRPPLVLTPGAKYVALIRERAFWFLETATGQPRGRLPIPKLFPEDTDKVWVFGAAVSHDGRLFTTYAMAPSDQLMTWDLETGELLWHRPFPWQPADDPGCETAWLDLPLFWCDAKRLMVGCYAVDATNGQILRTYTPDAVVFVPGSSPDGRQWFVSDGRLIALDIPKLTSSGGGGSDEATSARRSPDSHFAASGFSQAAGRPRISSPRSSPGSSERVSADTGRRTTSSSSSSSARFVSARPATSRPLGDLILRPGSKISFKLRLIGDAELRRSFDWRVARAVGHKLGLQKISIEPGQPLTLAITARIRRIEASPESPRETSPLFFDVERGPRLRLECTMVIADETGAVRWAQAFSREERALLFRGQKYTREEEKRDRRWLWDKLAKAIERTRLPGCVFEKPPELAIADTKLPVRDALTRGARAAADPLAKVKATRPLSTVSAGGLETSGLAFSLAHPYRLATCGRELSNKPPLKVWDLRKRSLYRQFPCRMSLTCAAFSPDGTLLAVGTNQGAVLVFRMRGSSRDKPRTYIPRTRSEVTSLAWSADGQTLLSGYADGVIGSWPGTHKGPGQLVKKFRAAIQTMQYTPDGNGLFVVIGDRTARVVDLQTKAHRDLASGVTCGALSFDGNLVAVGRDDYVRGGVQLIRVDTGQVVDVLGLGLRITATAFSPDGKMLALGERSGRVSVWDVQSITPLVVLSGHTREIRRLLFSPEGQWLAAAASFEKDAHVWSYRQ